MATKFDVLIFFHFKYLVENWFQTKINSLYSDNGGEFMALKSYLLVHGISYYTTAPHTPQKIAPPNVDIATYLKPASPSFTMPLLICPIGLIFQIASYLIN